MRIEIWGGRGEGKTTFAHRLKKLLEREGYEVAIQADNVPPTQRALSEAEFTLPTLEIWERH